MTWVRLSIDIDEIWEEIDDDELFKEAKERDLIPTLDEEEVEALVEAIIRQVSLVEGDKIRDFFDNLDL